MFEAFGERANSVIRIAEAEAKRLGHKLVGTEHILLGISIIDDCVPSRAMQKCGLSQEILRQEIISLTGWGEKLDFGGNLIFDPSAKKAMEYSMEVMIQDQREFISVEHLFLGITQKCETIASILLEKRGQIRTRLRDEIRSFMEQSKSHEKTDNNRTIDEDYRTHRTGADTVNALKQRIAQLEKQLGRSSGIAGIRTGIGFDSHMLVKGRPLVIGGVRIPFPMGLKGHSDADVLLHAIIDAIFGALGVGDIGTHFPDTDKRYKNISSVTLLEECEKILEERGFQVENLDSIVIAEKPKVGPYEEEMKKVISRVLRIEPSQVSVKAKTAEGMGFIGEGRGIASYAVATVFRPYREGMSQQAGGNSEA